MEKKFEILADVTCDLSKNFQEKYDIEVIMGHYTTPDGVEHESITSWSNEERDAFYKNLKKNPNGYTSAPPSVGETFKAFEKHVKEGRSILAMSISGGISGTLSILEKAKEMILEIYKDANIKIVDSFRFGPGFGLMAIYASNLRAEGKDLDEVYAWLEENKNHFHQSGWLDDLSFVAKKGRLTNAKAFFGTLVGIKPIGEFDYNGLTTVIGKVKGEKNAYKVLLKYIEASIINPSEQIIFIATTNRHAQAEVFKNMIIEKFHPKEIYINDVYSNCGINVGPGLMAAYYYGTPISKNLEKERELFNKITENLGD